MPYVILNDTFHMMVYLCFFGDIQVGIFFSSELFFYLLPFLKYEQFHVCFSSDWVTRCGLTLADGDDILISSIYFL